MKPGKKKTKLRIVVDKAAFFLAWELPFFRENFELVGEPREDAVLLAFGPDVLESASMMPALKRTAILFPGFSFNPYHNLACREKTILLVKKYYDLVFVNPGPVEEALRECPKIVSHPFTVDVDKLLKLRRTRNTIDSLIHVSANSPQKDWERSEKVMELTGLRYEVYPSRSLRENYTIKEKISWRLNKYVMRYIDPIAAFRTQIGYSKHSAVMNKYVEFDGFVHIAAEKPDSQLVDGKYTAALLEAGITGSIIFWHDTFNLGNDFETILSLPQDVHLAANEILYFRRHLDVRKHSKETSKEIAERCHPRRIVKLREECIENLLNKHD